MLGIIVGSNNSSSSNSSRESTQNMVFYNRLNCNNKQINGRVRGRASSFLDKIFDCKDTVKKSPLSSLESEIEVI